jgi:hypothetical protein
VADERYEEVTDLFPLKRREREGECKRPFPFVHAALEDIMNEEREKSREWSKGKGEKKEWDFLYLLLEPQIFILDPTCQPHRHFRSLVLVACSGARRLADS